MIAGCKRQPTIGNSGPTHRLHAELFGAGDTSFGSATHGLDAA
jgi:hypothetical protein